MGVSLPTVDKWQREGCPVEGTGGRGRAFKFKLADVMAWWSNREKATTTDPMEVKDAELRRRRLIADTGIAELEFAKARGDVALVEEFEKATEKLMGIIRANIMNVPARAVLQLLGETDEAAFKEKLRKELALALEQSAGANFDLDEEDETEA